MLSSPPPPLLRSQLWHGLLGLSSSRRAEGLTRCLAALLSNAIAACEASPSHSGGRIELSVKPDDSRRAGVYCVKVRLAPGEVGESSLASLSALHS